MLSKSSKWELSFVHYIVKFTISRFVISRFECTSYLITISLSLKFYACMTNVAVYLGKFFTSSHQSTIDLTWPLVSLFVIAALSTWGQFCQSPRLILFASDYYFWIWKKNHIQNLSCWVLSNDNRNDNEDNNDIDDNSDKNDDTMTTTVTTKVTATMTTTTTTKTT